MMFLIFVNELGPNYKGDNIYEFIFSDNVDDVWGEYWESKPSNSYPLPPNMLHIKKVAVLKNSEISLYVIQKSDYFSMQDSIDDVICLAWENESEYINFDLVKRLVFRFGESEESVKNKLYARDIVLEYEKKLNYESK